MSQKLPKIRDKDDRQIQYEAKLVAETLVKEWHDGLYKKRLRELIAQALIDWGKRED